MTRQFSTQSVFPTTMGLPVDISELDKLCELVTNLPDALDISNLTKEQSLTKAQLAILTSAITTLNGYTSSLTSNIIPLFSLIPIVKLFSGNFSCSHPKLRFKKLNRPCGHCLECQIISWQSHDD